MNSLGSYTSRIDYVHIDLSLSYPNVNQFDFLIEFRVGGIIDTSLYTITSTNPDEMHLIIRSKTEFINILGSPDPNNPYIMSLYYLAGNVVLYLYNNINDVRDSHNLMIFLYHNERGTDYVNDILGYADILMDYYIMLFANVRDFNFIDKSLYNLTTTGNRPYREDFICLFYGVFRYLDSYIYGAAVAIMAFYEYFKNGYLFCGMKYKTNMIYYNFNKQVLDLLLDNNVNFFQNRKILINPVTISGLFITDEINYNFIVKSLRLIFNSFINYPNDHNTWLAIRETIHNFFKKFDGNKCGSINYNLIIHDINNVPDVSTLIAEIQIAGITTRKTIFNNTIKLSVKLI